MHNETLNHYIIFESRIGVGNFRKYGSKVRASEPRSKFSARKKLQGHEGTRARKNYKGTRARGHVKNIRARIIFLRARDFYPGARGHVKYIRAREHEGTQFLSQGTRARKYIRARGHPIFISGHKGT